MSLPLLTRAMPLLAENRLGLLALAAAMTAPALLSGRRDGGGDEGERRQSGLHQSAANANPLPAIAATTEGKR